MSRGRAIALVDCDSFYASCEQLINPSLKGKPVCVMSNNDGCIVARSREAKLLGIKMGMPVFQAKKSYPEACYISGRLDLYGEISARVINTLKEFSPLIEIYSIDEAFIDLTGMRRLYRKTYLEIAKEIRTTVMERVGVPVSVGISLSKVLAKLAAERAKQNEGIYRIGFRSITEELRRTELIDIWGMGINTVALLNKYGINTAYEYTTQDEKWIKKILGKRGPELRCELIGESIYPIQDSVELPKSIQKTSSFAQFTSDETYIKNSLHYHTHRACKKLRSQGLHAEVVGVMLRTKDFKVYSASNVLLKSTNWEFEVFSTVEKVFKEIYLKDVVYRSSGVYLSNLTESSESQLSLFESIEDKAKKEKLAITWDKLEAKHGSNIMRVGIANKKNKHER